MSSRALRRLQEEREKEKAAKEDPGKIKEEEEQEEEDEDPEIFVSRGAKPKKPHLNPFDLVKKKDLLLPRRQDP